MKIQIESKDGVGMLAAFARILKTEVENGKVEVPGRFGSGYIKGVIFEDRFRLMIMDYQLNQDFSVLRSLQTQPSNMIIFAFYDTIRSKDAKQLTQSPQYPSVQITTQGLHGQSFTPSNTRQNQIAIAVDAQYLRGLLGNRIEGGIVKNILENSEQLLFEELVFQPILDVVDQMIEARMPQALEEFYYKIKSQELLCQLMLALLHRDSQKLYKISTASLKMLYAVKERMLDNLTEPPRIKELANFSAMSESSLKRLFKQVFGKSILQYYQTFRIQEAARLLREERLSVSEAGYRLGFTNLSHFTRAFEEHIGIKPKRYAMGI